MKRLARIIISSLIFYQALAAEPISGFKDILIGSDLAQVKDSPRFECSSGGAAGSDATCFSQGEETIAGQKANSVILKYYEHKLGAIYISFPSASFPKIAEALVQKYGSPKTRHEMLQNRLGATFDNSIHTWVSKDVILEASQYSDSIDKSTLVYVRSGAMEAYKKKKAEAAKENASDL